MGNRILVVLVGLPGAGKSTYRDILKEQGYFVVSSDDYIEDFASKSGSTYNAVFAERVQLANKLMRDDFKTYIKNGDDVIWDQTNLSVKKRKGILAQVPDNYLKLAVYFEIDEELRQQRLGNRPGKVIPPHVDDSMRGSYVRPTVEEGFDLVNSFDQYSLDAPV